MGLRGTKRYYGPLPQGPQDMSWGPCTGRRGEAKLSLFFFCFVSWSERTVNKEKSINKLQIKSYLVCKSINKLQIKSYPVCKYKFSSARSLVTQPHIMCWRQFQQVDVQVRTGAPFQECGKPWTRVWVNCVLAPTYVDLPGDLQRTAQLKWHLAQVQANTIATVCYKCRSIAIKPQLKHNLN